MPAILRLLGLAALAATVITYRVKSALRDIGRALGLEEAQIDSLTRSLAWWDDKQRLPERLREQGLDPQAPLVQQWLELTTAVRGFPRHLSQHVGGFVITQGRLSRLVPAKEAKETKAGLADGTVNIVVGTHALLAKSIEFKDLGLLIVDEEQHFGVAHKERLKDLRSEVHMLTLSATPIRFGDHPALSATTTSGLLFSPGHVLAHLHRREGRPVMGC